MCDPIEDIDFDSIICESITTPSESDKSIISSIKQDLLDDIKGAIKDSLIYLLSEVKHYVYDKYIKYIIPCSSIDDDMQLLYDYVYEKYHGCLSVFAKTICFLIEECISEMSKTYTCVAHYITDLSEDGRIISTYYSICLIPKYKK